jgi:hypothetical protein
MKIEFIENENTWVTPSIPLIVFLLLDILLIFYYGDILRIFIKFQF